MGYEVGAELAGEEGAFAGAEAVRAGKGVADWGLEGAEVFVGEEKGGGWCCCCYGVWGRGVGFFTLLLLLLNERIERGEGQGGRFEEEKQRVEKEEDIKEYE